MPQTYVLEGPIWSSKTITWSFGTSTYAADSTNAFSSNITSPYQDTVRQAFAAWAAVSSLTFKEVPDTLNMSMSADIRVGFGALNTQSTGAVGYANYSYTTSSSAYSTFMPDVLVRLEDPAQVGVTANAGGYTYNGYSTNMLQVAEHEVGHALGLDHDLDTSSVMFASLGINNRSLDATDIAGIQALYGPPAPVPVPVPAPVPAPVPVPAPAPVSVPVFQSGLVLNLSEDAYLGDAQFTVAVDGQQIGGVQSVTALHSLGQSQTFNLGGTFAAGPHSVDVSFINDAWGGTPTTDRNLYVDGVSINGIAASGGTGPLFSNGTLTGTLTLPSVSTIAPAPVYQGGLVLNLSEDAYLGDAQFTVAVDGQQIGGAQSVTALHSLGQSQTFNLGGTFAAGPHSVDVSFINDAWGGTAATDRNLYVDGVSINGVAASGGTGSLFSNGTLTGTLTLPTAPALMSASAPATAVLGLKLSEDAYLGDAQFTVAVDGKTIGIPQSVTALHSNGQSQAFTVGGALSVGSHNVSISFINDAWGGTVTTDRNLYVDNLTLNGLALPATSAALFSNGHADFVVNVASAALATPATAALPASYMSAGDATYATPSAASILTMLHHG